MNIAAGIGVGGEGGSTYAYLHLQMHIAYRLYSVHFGVYTFTSCTSQFSKVKKCSPEISKDSTIL